MKVEINERRINVKCDFSTIQNRRTNKNHENEYIVTSYIFTDKELNSYEKEKIGDFITQEIRKD